MYLSEVSHPVGVLLREEEVVRADLAGHAEAALLGQADHLKKKMWEMKGGLSSRCEFQKYT